MPKHFSKEDRLRLLKDYPSSSLTVKAYALKNGVGYSTFQKWISRYGISLKKKEKTVGLDLLEIKGHQKASQRKPVRLVDQVSQAPGSRIEFMDITETIFSPAKEERASVRISPDTKSLSASLSPPLSSEDPLALSCQLDVFLPNGIRMTLHQASFSHSIAMIKALV
jgi:hypothetical protein